MQMLENTLIKGVKKVSDKVFRYAAINSREWIEVKKYDPISIIKGIETYVALINEDGNNYWEVFEGVTGVVIGRSFSGEKEKREEAVKKATKLLNSLQEKGILVDVLTKVATHITNGLSPRYKGDIIGKNDHFGELRKLNVGDKVSIINLRGGLHYKTALVDSYKNVTRGMKEVKEYKLIADNTGYTFYKVIDSDYCSSFYSEPEFVELYEEVIMDIKANKIENNIDPTSLKDKKAWQDDLRAHLVLADKADYYSTYTSEVLQESKRLNNIEISADAAEYNNLLLSNGYILTEAKTIENRVNYLYYVLLLPSIKRVLRLKLFYKDGVLYYSFSISSNQERLTAFNVRWVITQGYINSLKEVLVEISKIVSEMVVTSTAEPSVKEEMINMNLQDVEVNKEILEIVKSSTAKIYNSDKKYTEYEKSIRESAEKSLDKEVPDKLLEIDKFLLTIGFIRSYNDMFTADKYHVVYFLPITESRKFYRLTCNSYEKNNELIDGFEIRIIEPWFCEDSLIYAGEIDELEDILTQCLDVGESKIIKDDQVDDYAEDKSVEIRETKIYTLVEIAQLGINIIKTPVQVENITTLSNEEFVSKRNAIWKMKIKAEDMARLTNDYSYTEIYTPLYELLSKEERKRCMEYSEALTEEEKKHFAIKWLCGESTLAAYKEGGKERVEAIIKQRCSSCSGGTLTGDYRYYIGSVQCGSNKITARFKDNSKSKISMTIKEATEMIINYYSETIVKTESNIIQQTVKIEAKADASYQGDKDPNKINQVSFIEISASEVERKNSNHKNKKRKSSLIEGQMMIVF